MRATGSISTISSRERTATGVKAHYLNGDVHIAAKKLTFKVKGKEGDLKHGTVSWSITYEPYWGKGIQPW